MKIQITLIVTLCAIALSCISSNATSPTTPTKIAPKLIQKLINDNFNKVLLNAEELEILDNNLQCEMKDLNADGKPEYFLHIEHSDFCGAGANCSYWIYQKTFDDYKLLLTEKVLRPQETITNGYRDLQSETPMGFCAKNVQRLATRIYKFDGNNYQYVSSKTDCRAFTPKE